MGFLFQENSEFLPLCLCGIDASGVMCAGVEKDNAVIWGVCDCLFHASEIEALGRFGEVGISGDWEVDVGEDLVVICPCWVAEIDGGFARVEFRQKKSAEMDGSCAGDGLKGGRAFF